MKKRQLKICITLWPAITDYVNYENKLFKYSIPYLSRIVKVSTEKNKWQVSIDRWDYRTDFFWCYFYQCCRNSTKRSLQYASFYSCNVSFLFGSFKDVQMGSLHISQSNKTILLPFEGSVTNSTEFGSRKFGGKIQLWSYLFGFYSLYWDS